MFEKVYLTEGKKPVEELQRLLAESRIHNSRFKVSLGAPPFERDGRDKIIGIRLRFEPMRSVAADT